MRWITFRIVGKEERKKGEVKNDDKSWKEKGKKHIHEFKLQIGSQDKTLLGEGSNQIHIVRQIYNSSKYEYDCVHDYVLYSLVNFTDCCRDILPLFSG